MRGIVKWQIMAEGLKHAAPPWADFWPCSSPCFPPFICSTHSSHSFQQEPSLFPALTAERILNLTLYESHRGKANKWQMMKTPCPVTKCAGTPLRKGSVFQTAFSMHHPWGLGMFHFVFKGSSGVEPGKGLLDSRESVGGFALCWIKPDLLKFFGLLIFRSQWIVLPRGTLHLENSSSQTFSNRLAYSVW